MLTALMILNLELENVSFLLKEVGKNVRKILEFKFIMWNWKEIVHRCFIS